MDDGGVEVSTQVHLAGGPVRIALSHFILRNGLLPKGVTGPFLSEHPVDSPEEVPYYLRSLCATDLTGGNEVVNVDVHLHQGYRPLGRWDLGPTMAVHRVFISVRVKVSPSIG